MQKTRYLCTQIDDLIDFLMKTRLLIFCMSLIALMTIGCNDMRYVETVMDNAEELMTDRPDSAYQMLRTLDAQAIDGERLHARYALLYTKAQYKNYREDGNDSLITIAVRYYDAKGMKTELMESLMLLSVQLRIQERYDESMLNLHRAADIGEELGDHFMLGRIYTNLFLLCSLVLDSDDLRYAEKAYNHYKLDGNDDYIIDGMCNLGIAYYHHNEFDKSTSLLDSVYQWALKTKDDFSVKKSGRFLAMINASEGKYESADSLFQMLHNQYGYNYEADDMWALAEACLVRNQKEQAVSLMEQAAAMKKNVTNDIYFSNVASRFYSKIGRYEEALSYLNRSDVKYDSLVTIRLRESVLASQRDYVVQKLELEQIRSSRNNILWISTASGLLALLAFIFYYYRRKMETQSLQMETQSLQMENLLLQVADMKNDALSRDTAIAGLSEQIYELFDQKYRQIDSLCISYFSGQNTMYARNAIYREVQKIIESFGSDEASFAELERIVDASRDGVLTKLKTEVPKLRDADYRYFCYAFAGFSSRAISLLSNESIDSVYQHHSRWKKRIETLDPPHKDLFLQYLR